MLRLAGVLSLFVAAPCAALSTNVRSIPAPVHVVGSQQLDWPNIGFTYQPTRSFVYYRFRDGAWDAGEEREGEPTVSVHVGATALHYGQSLFEGLKAFACADGSVKLFRPTMNAARMARGAARTLMEAPPEALFLEACTRAVKANLDYVPPYGSGGALYVRPLLFGAGARIGLQPADAYDLIVLVTPVGEYYKGGLQPVACRVVEDCDRAAPRGVGSVKLAGNYAPDLQPNLKAKMEGFPIGLYLDAGTRTLVEEFSTSNFIGINVKDKKYVTPLSDAILPSITNDSLMKLAAAAGFEVDRRPVPYAEVAAGDFDEIAACGTAVVLTPIGSITRGDDTVTLGQPGKAGEVCSQLYDTMTKIQRGDLPDPYGWTLDVL